VLLNLLHSTFAGRIYAVNPNRQELCGLKAYPNIRVIPEAADLAIVVTPASAVPAVVRDCMQASVKACVVISAGFRERGPEGLELENQIREQLRGGGMRLIGPNCLGVMNPLIGLNATFAKDPPKAGNVAFLSQSGALLTAILDWSHQQEVGFSAIVSTGSMLDVGWGDLISHIGDDPNTHSILLYMESVGDARSFLSAAREVALSKPIIVIKAGKSEAASRAAASHTGALTGSDEVLDAAFRRSGVLRVRNIADLFYMADVLSKQVRPKGPRLTIVTNAGGPAVLATDSLVSHGGELAVLSQGSLKAFDEFLPAHWSHNNPIDLLGDADPERYARALEIAAKDPNSDGLMVVLAPQGMTDPGRIAQKLEPYAKSTKPILASFMGGDSITPAKAVLNDLGIPLFSYPDTAAKVVCYMWQYTYNLRGLYETPVLAEGPDTATAKGRAAKIIDQVRSSGRKLLNEVESKQLLAAYDIPTVETHVAISEDDAVRMAVAMAFPVVLKLFSETITHKTDVGGVKLNLSNEVAVRRAFQEIKSSVSQKAGVQHFAGVTVQPMVRLDGYELILGSSVDAQFGPVLLFGSGGQLVEIYRDRAIALPPLNTTLAHRLMEQTRIFTALKGVRGRKAVNIVELEKLLVRFSELVVEQPWISEIDINPLLASVDGFIALDARVVLHGADLTEDKLPKSAIRPYPSQYIWQFTTRNGTPVTIRPIRPEDEPLMVKFHETLSDRTVYLRYFGSLSLRTRIAHERLVRICFGDYDREMALVAEHLDGVRNPEIIGVGTLSRLHGRDEAEVAVLVSDKCQNQGLGTELLSRAIHVAREEKIRAISGEMLQDNIAMQMILRTLGFQIQMPDCASSVRARLEFPAYTRS
jgi:acetyltransferase